ncbi:hypothetical protein CSC94_02880 [Zhengella mangrovi]|uniref:DUF883 domain-containing protein n=1 Tax=Zhengella mangrovi TaxID=1982044 RepID=A0A2G1QTR1_9HYPH|nr:DUF883 family protein [Zhengella mangrovi]PHP68947.1 hypothetical protein CSC94_02880 [Zhengella mangrovi]
MATATQQRTATISGKNNGSTSAADIEAQIGQLKGDISKLAQTIGEYGSAKAGEAKTSANAKVDEAILASRDVLENARSEVDRLERILRNEIRRKPIQTIGIAAGIGFLAALLMRR